MPGFDPNTATPSNEFDPTTATSASVPGATGLGMLGEMFGDLTNPNHPQHDPNALETGIMGAANNPIVRGASATFHQAVDNGPFMNGIPSAARVGMGLIPGGKEFAQSIPVGMLPGDVPGVRDTMENMGIGQQQGETRPQLHQRYNAAITNARANDTAQANAAQVGGGPNPTLGDRAARLGQQAVNFGANMVANPEYALIPGMGVGPNALSRIATSAAGNAALGGVSDAAAQLMDVAEGQKKDFDVQQNLQSTLAGGLFGGVAHGAIEVAPFVKNLFSTRGLDTTPASDPRPFQSQIQPQTTDHLALNAADHMQYQQLLKTGSVDDIKGFFQGRNGPAPSWSDVNDWVEHRDNPPTSTNGISGPDPTRQPDFNYEQEQNAHAQGQWEEQNRQAVEDHVNNRTSGWKNAPDVEVVHGPEGIADPDIRAQAIKEDGDGNALGFLGSDGKVRMYSGRITDPDTANAVLFHEGLGHFGLAQKFGAKLDTTIQSLLDRNVGQFSTAVDAWQKVNPDAYGGSRVRAAEEVLAEASQNGRVKSSWQDAVGSAVKQFGRRMGLKLNYSDAEVNHVLAMSHDAVIKGTDGARANGFRGATQDPNKFMFIGQQARGFDPEHLTADIGNDGRYRNEISDKGARLYDSPGDTLGSTLHHPELYDNYPSLHGMKIIRGESSDYAGYYHSGEDHPLGRHIFLSTNSAHDPMDVISHEVQHAIQHMEQYPDFMRAVNSGGTHMDDQYGYRDHPSEVEARATEARRGLDMRQRIERVPPRFMRTDALGREQVNPEDLDTADRLKNDPRFWSDPEYRKNVNEYLRTQNPVDTDGKSEAPSPFKYASEADARASGNKFITKSQLASTPGYQTDDLERAYKSLTDNYVPTTRTWEEDRQAALAVGFKPSQIKDLAEHNPGDLSVRLHRMQAAANMADMKIRDLNERLDTPQWTEQDAADYIKALADYNYLVPRIKGERAEIARALNISKAAGAYSNSSMEQVRDLLAQQASGLSGLTDLTSFMKFARQLKQIMGANPTVNPKGVRVMMLGVNKPYWEQYLTTFHMNMMLSALSTHVKAPVDMATGITRNVIEKMIAMPIGKARQMFEGMTGRTVQPGVETAELANHIAGIMRAVSDAEVYRAVAHAAVTGESSYVTNGQRTPTQFANQFGAISNPRIPGISIPTDLIGAQDTFFRSTEMNGQLETIGVREARAQLGSKASTSDVMTLGHNIATNPTPSMLKEAFSETNRTLLLNDNPVNAIINKARTYRPNMTPSERVGAFIASNLAPFIRVESNNLINRIIQRSPLAFLDPTGYTQAQLKAGGAKADIAMSKMLYGTVLLGMYWTAADKAKDYLTGSGPDNVNKYKEQIASGWRPEAVHENGGYNTGGQLGMSVNPFDMHNKTAQLVASARQAYEAGMSAQGWGSAFKMAMGSLFSNLAGMSWVSDIQPAVDAIRAHGQEGQSAVSSFVSQQAGTWMPNALNQASRIMDPNQRDTSAPNSISGAAVNQMQSEIPGLREQLPIKYSVYGTPLANGASLTGVHTMIPGLSGNGTTETHDPAEMELDRLSSLVPGALVTPVTKTITLDDGTKKPLTPGEFEEYQRVAGRAIVETVKGEMSTSDWHSMSDQDRVLEVRDIQTDMKKAAREALFNPS